MGSVSDMRRQVFRIIPVALMLAKMVFIMSLKPLTSDPIQIRALESWNEEHGSKIDVEWVEAAEDWLEPDKLRQCVVFN